MKTRSLSLLIALAALVACDERTNPTLAHTPVPALVAPTGHYVLTAVNDTLLPHTTTFAGTTYLVTSGTFDLSTDSTWFYHSVNSQASNGVIYGTSPASQGGRWTATDSTIELVQPTAGTLRVKGDTLFWSNAPKFQWESPLTFTMVKQ
jgi:hypothetical protein